MQKKNMSALTKLLSKRYPSCGWHNKALSSVNFARLNLVAPYREYHHDDETAINLNLYKNIETPVPPVWLRHHCQCGQCIHPSTFQRLKIPSDLKGKCRIENVTRHMENISEDDSFQVVWNDGHVSRYSLKWLEETLSPENNMRPENLHFYRDTSSFSFPKDVADVTVDYREFMGKEQVLLQLMKYLHKFGVALISNSPPDVSSTERAVRRISHPQATIYGGMFEFESNLLFADTAYTSDFVHMHTDATYFTEPNGLQVFHCLEHEGEGGINAVVDGFRIAREIQQENLVQYEILSNTPVPWHYVDPGKHHFYNIAPIFQHDPFTGKFQCFRYNPHDMAPLNTIPVSKLSEFYSSIINLSDRVESGALWLKLSPGMILFTDNWRVLHGRTAFTGYRKMCGCYISRSDWLSKCKVMLRI